MGPRTVLIVSHGSRETSANREFVRLVAKYRERHPRWKVGHAYLDVVGPTIHQGLAHLAHDMEKGTIEVLPYFLFRAKHVKKDIPAILAAFQKERPGIKVHLAKPLGDDPRLLHILDQRLPPTRKNKSRKG
ncbi:MAG TPA: CbiX/SirB N-terminal domain-containing protein [bacterium]|nr:CbiX/SirB N-terminal domain-containing protein [bacterium]